MSAYTPYPWRADRAHNGYTIDIDHPAHAGGAMPSGRYIAEIRFRRTGASRGNAVRYIGNDTDDANARLIAAAPELLAALHALISAVDDSPPMDVIKNISLAAGQARAAIAKAES